MAKAPPDLEPRRVPPRWLVPLGVAVLVLGLMVGLRVYDLGIDPPRHVLDGYDAQAHFRDEVAKAHEARNKALYGEWYLGEHDTYRFWRRQSPVWVWSQYFWFETFGVGWTQARAFAVVHALIALAVLFWLALVRHGLAAAVVATLLLGLCWPFVVYSRLALMEAAVIGYLMLAALGLERLDADPGRARLWAPFAALAFLGACFTKQSGLLLLPPFVVAMGWIGLSHARTAAADELTGEWRERARVLLRQPVMRWALVGLAAVAVVLLVQVLDPSYGDRLRFNAKHFTRAKGASPITSAWHAFWDGLFGERMWLIVTVLAPAPVMLGGLEVLRSTVAGLRAWREQRLTGAPVSPLEAVVDPVEAWMVLWFVLALAASLASPARAIRFQLFIVPPAAWLAGALAGRVWRQAWTRPWQGVTARVALVLAVAIPAAASLERFGAWMRDSGHTAERAGPELERLLGDRHAVVVGEFAAQVTFETPYVHYYVRRELGSGTRDAIEAMQITHVVFERRGDFVRKRMRKVTPAHLLGLEHLGTILYMDRELAVFELAPEKRRRKLWKKRQKRKRARRRGQQGKKHTKGPTKGAGTRPNAKQRHKRRI